MDEYRGEKLDGYGGGWIDFCIIYDDLIKVDSFVCILQFVLVFQPA